MIFFDTTKTGAAGHRSGLMRVSARLRDELGSAATAVSWPEWDRQAGPGDWFLTGEPFSDDERPGFADFLAARRCRCAAIFHDAIPLRYPHITWPRSVARHPRYLKMLSQFDRIWAVSAASRTDLLGFWGWQGVATTPPVDVLALGADFRSGPRPSSAGMATAPGSVRRSPGEGGPAVHPPVLSAGAAPGSLAEATIPSLLCVGILEPRKNQAFLLEVCVALWREGLRFDLHLAGRVNPHFGEPVRARLKELQRDFPGLHYHATADDAALGRLYAAARASVFPTIAEGCGLPLLESLWQGVPCVASDLPVLRENGAGGGCLFAAVNDPVAWQTALRGVLTDDALQQRLAAEAGARALPTWADAALALRAGLTAS